MEFFKNEDKTGKYCKNIIIFLGAGIGVYLAFQYLFPLTAPFLLSFCIVYALNRRLNRVQLRTHIKKEVVLAGILVLAAAFALALLWGGFQYGAAWAGALSENWAGFRARVNGQLQIFFGDCCMYVEEHFGVNAGKVEQIILERVEIFVEELQVEFVPKLMQESWWYGKKVLGAAAFLGVSFIASLLLCKDYDQMMERLRVGEGGEWLDRVLGVVERVLRLVVVYVKAQAMILLVIMLLCCLGLWIGRIGNAAALGILAGILDALPFIGTGIVLMPTAFWQLVNGRFGAAAWCVALYVCCVGVREFLEPKLMGKRTGIYPVFMLLSVYAGVKLFGLGGIIKGPLALVVLAEVWKASSCKDFFERL